MFNFTDGFYERDKKGGSKKPFRIMLKSGQPFGLAGLWDEWINKDTGGIIHSCAIITTAANELIIPIHDRMPVILPREAQFIWFDQSIQAVPNQLFTPSQDRCIIDHK